MVPLNNNLENRIGEHRTNNNTSASLQWVVWIRALVGKGWFPVSPEPGFNSKSIQTTNKGTPWPHASSCKGRVAGGWLLYWFRLACQACPQGNPPLALQILKLSPGFYVQTYKQRGVGVLWSYWRHFDGLFRTTKGRGSRMKGAPLKCRKPLGGPGLTKHNPYHLPGSPLRHFDPLEPAEDLGDLHCEGTSGAPKAMGPADPHLDSTGR